MVCQDANKRESMFHEKSRTVELTNALVKTFYVSDRFFEYYQHWSFKIFIHLSKCMYSMKVGQDSIAINVKR